jgi:hypothetical protein
MCWKHRLMLASQLSLTGSIGTFLGFILLRLTLKRS